MRLLPLALILIVGCTAPQESSPFQVVDAKWGELPDGREWGATSAVHPAPDGRIWVGERCAANSCADSGLDPVLLFDTDGTLVRSFGAGMILWPHGIEVDPEGNVWITDARGADDIGHQVHKFSAEGELLLSLGTAGEAGEDEAHFNGPSDVLVAPDGSIFVADGHGRSGNNRIVKFAADGTYLMTWGSTGAEAGEFRDPHALAMDSDGRLFVGDRGNSRTQIFDQEGTHIATWTQFGRPSGLFIDDDDILYSADSESNATWAANPGWHRGIRIGSVVDGWVTHFIPDVVVDADSVGTSGAEGVAVDQDGFIYGAEVGPRGIAKYRLR